MNIKIKAKRATKRREIMEWKRAKAERRKATTTFINTRFEGSSAHHLETKIVIYIPDTLHKSVRHNLKKGTNMLEINGLAMAWFEGLLQQALEVSNGLD